MLFCELEDVFAAKISDTKLKVMDVPHCGYTDDEDDEEDSKRTRQKRWETAGYYKWENMPLQISVANGVRGFSIGDVESIAIECARVSLFSLVFYGTI